MNAKRKQRGFTLIDMMVVATVVSITAATAVPKYIGLTNDVKQATAQGIASALGSASASNVLLRNAGSPLGIPVTDCTDVAQLLLPAQMSGFSVAPHPVAPGSTATCIVDHAMPGDSTAAAFLAHGTS